MKIIGETNDSNRDGMRIFYTVETGDGRFADVMHCQRKEKDFFYVMQMEDGKTCYDSEGKTLELSAKEESDIICLVKNHVSRMRTQNICGNDGKTERTDVVL